METEIIDNIQKLYQNKKHLLIAIDGRCASGKTTLAKKLHRRLGGNLFQMDDFFLRPEQRTQERLKEPGGNVDYERFKQEVMEPLAIGVEFAYQPFSCHSQSLLKEILIQNEDINIIEGSYACHPALWHKYDFRIFLTTSREEQYSRIRNRNGEVALQIFQNKWIPLEERYFNAYNIENRCDMVFQT